jgi:UTP--glucose-1-phosphate uridylyltransferase
MSTFPPIRKAVFPVAGHGTRFLPATKSIPKEMLPIVDRPLIQYAVEEAIAAGIDSLIFITSGKKHAIADYFDVAFELETLLLADGKEDLLSSISNIVPEHVSRTFVTQPRALGLGHAVLCARPIVGDEPFAVLLPDDMVKTSGPGALAQMVAAYQQSGTSVIGVEDVPREATSRYGIVGVEDNDQGQSMIRTIVEKPAPEDAPSTLGVVGRYILDPAIFSCLENAGAGIGGEIQLTDSIDTMMKDHPVMAFPFEGTRYDCGSQLGFIKATLDYALDREEFNDDLRLHLANVIKKAGE